jgi:probable inactive serine/threonine-protein kinase scy2
MKSVSFFKYHFPTKYLFFIFPFKFAFHLVQLITFFVIFVACFDDLFLNMSNIRDVINSVKEASDPYANWESFNDDVSSNVKPNLFGKLENTLIGSTTSTPSLNELVKIEPPSTLSRKSKAKLKTLEFNLDNFDQAFEIKEDKVSSSLNNEAKVEKDRYAAFSEIHSMTSIFDSILPQTQESNTVISEFANFDANFDNNLFNQDSPIVDCKKDNFTESNSTHQSSDKSEINYPLAPITISSSLNFQEARPCSSASRNPFLSDSLSESSDDPFTNSPSLVSPVPSLNANLSNNNANNNTSGVSNSNSNNNSNSSNSYSNGNDNCDFEKSNFSAFFDTNQGKSFSESNTFSSCYTTANSTTNESSKDALSYFGISWAQDALGAKPNSLLSNSSLNSTTSNATSNIFTDPFLDNCECPPPAPLTRLRPRGSPSIGSFSSTSSDTPPPPVPPRPIRNDNSITLPPPPLPKRKPTINSDQSCSIQISQNSAFAPPLPLPQRKAQQLWSKESTLFTPSHSWQSNSKSTDSQEFDLFNCAFLNQDLDSFKSQQSVKSNNKLNTNIISNNINSNSSNSSSNILKKDNKIASKVSLSNIRLSSGNLDKHSTPKQTLNQEKFNFEDVSQLSTIPTPNNQDLNSIDFSFSTTDTTLNSVFESLKESKEENKSSNQINSSEKQSSKVKSDPFEDDFFQ